MNFSRIIIFFFLLDSSHKLNCFLVIACEINKIFFKHRMLFFLINKKSRHHFFPLLSSSNSYHKLWNSKKFLCCTHNELINYSNKTTQWVPFSINALWALSWTISKIHFLSQLTKMFSIFNLVVILKNS